MLHAREVAGQFSDNVSRWTAEALIALQEVRSSIIRLNYSSISVNYILSTLYRPSIYNSIRYYPCLCCIIID